MSVYNQDHRTVRLGNRTVSSIVMNGMYRREARKLAVEMSRPCQRQGHMPLDVQLQENRWKVRRGLSPLKR